ncbi:hypothetical protein RhiirA1_532104 [Rhizophagus irregularis]|uniref:Uncharacterized protein n=2 Tax=Rhizophagus irregularis TaxID=588596 RepID=A0A2I1DZ43_9GLOM|nr:hypothetical protein GLOIN_2v1775738 [Rhizophagus irregularis DAOM 181602=DAOM 197198]PKC71250.1 hypothetical protein RhiirA1_532104 [Rhizophagus irregularis]PKY15149.1 hypothetical protein RhiirB3_520172 [Rhizophagus irregularis]POG70604.1 hypothetical protein GLOIN_2v1775738 [Rhizophagus irregularis DAOM 181602=DAOM 197198]|eukprot:XP_025177470.1 hypothetical protein GLOIN_2v1775738 [Rhizophagus irregularis DAOM 181602=DAOM 197198]
MEKDFLKVEIQNRKGAKRKLNDEIKKQLLDDLLKNAIRLEKKGQDLFSNIGTIKFIRKRLIQHRKLSSWDSTNKDLYLNNFENARLLYIDENLHLEFLFWLVVRMCRGQTKHTESKDEYFASHSVYHFKLE